MLNLKLDTVIYNICIINLLFEDTNYIDPKNLIHYHTYIQFYHIFNNTFSYVLEDIQVE